MARLAMGGVTALAMTACGAVYDGVEGSNQSDGEAIDDVGNVGQQIINGSTNFTGREFQQNRTVQVRTPVGAICSGTLLLPNVIMTARHCVTTDSSIGGPLGAPTSVRARIRSAPVAPMPPPGSDDCTGIGRNPTCSASTLIQATDTTTDIAFVRLEKSLSFNGEAAMFTPIEVQSGATANDAYLGMNLMATGWGRNTCADGAGTLRWGTVNVASTSANGGQMRLNPTAANQNTYRGDSGGPTWGTRSFPDAALGVHSTVSCTNTADGSQAGPAFDVQFAHDFNYSRNSFGLASTLGDYTENLSSLARLTRVNVEADAAPDWQIIGSHLTQKANSNTSVVLVREEIVHRVLGGVYSVTVTSSDNDTTGVVFSYVDPNNYLTCEVNDQDSYLRLVSRRSGQSTVLATTSWTGTFSSAVTISADVVPSFGGTWSFPIECTVSGGGVANKSVTSTNTTLPAGRVGIVNTFLDEATYSNFVVNSVM